MGEYLQSGIILSWTFSYIINTLHEYAYLRIFLKKGVGVTFSGISWKQPCVLDNLWYV